MASGGGASVRVKRIVKKGLRSIERSSKLLSHERCSVSRPGSERSGNRVHPRAHRRPSQGKPSRAVVEAVYGVAMGATERRTVRRDRSRASAQPSPLVSIELPEPRYRFSTPYHRNKPGVVELDSTPLRARLSTLQPLEFRQVRRTEQEAVFNGLIETHHYLGYKQPVGAHLKYLVLSQGRPVACVSFSSAPRHLGARDRFIGWSSEARRRNIRFIAYNPRFLILPWVFVPHLASHILGRMARLLPRHWEQSYGYCTRRIYRVGAANVTRSPKRGWRRESEAGRQRPRIHGSRSSSARTPGSNVAWLGWRRCWRSKKKPPNYWGSP